ncbi:MAG: ribosomal protein S18 acetylase RimI-like enzyme [Alteromonadaceae bacterium]|jgi:ribosomal protein S18 acetylase RimI-like enzyme|tara:strand:+ start:698 stop:1150 length:453 start_codon:yes stop_codon:yes gene_type:complete
MHIRYRKATKEDLNRCIEIRGLTNDNAFSKSELAAIGVTEESWPPLIESGEFIGFVALENNVVISFCFGDTNSGEILVLAVLAGYEGHGIGKQLLSLTSKQLILLGHSELWLAASATAIVRAYGFYRHVGWQATNTYDENGDEILKYREI